MDNVCYRRAAVSGFIATFVMTITGLWMAGVGLPRMDVGAMVLGGMNGPIEEGAEPTYTIAWGQAAHFLNGIVLAFIYAMWLYRALPGSDLVKGVIYGVITTLAAGIVVVPIITAAAGQPSGILLVNAPDTGMRIVGSLIVHLAYGVTLGVAYKPHPGAQARHGAEGAV